MIKTKPFLKWAGNKFRCIENILASMPEGTRLIEPFTGSGAIFVNSNYHEYILAEKNKDLVMLFKYLQKEGVKFINYCSELFCTANNFSDRYYQLRNEFNQCKQSKRRAALFLYLNRHGYNGLCRYNQRGLYNVPYGRYNKPYFPHKEMVFFYEKSTHVEFIYSDFRKTFNLAKPGDVIYCDPPYVPLSASANFSSYVEKIFSERDQIELAELALASAKKGITVIISNHDTAFTRYHYQQGEIRSFPVHRYISCKANLRRPVQELVAIFRK